MDTARPGSESSDRREYQANGATTRKGSNGWWRRLPALALCGVLAASAALAEAPAEGSPGPAPIVVPPPLGASEASLRERFGASLRQVEVTRTGSVFEQIAPERAPSNPDAPGHAPRPVQSRLARPCAGDVRTVEYDLWEGRVYRVRWRLAERFERPILGDVVERITDRLGRPDYDQTLRAELGSERADLRRTGWSQGRRALEIRQLHPFNGGPIFLSVSDLAAMQAIVDAKGVPLSQPETTGAWWRRPQRPPHLLGPEERGRLAGEIDALFEKLAEAPR